MVKRTEAGTEAVTSHLQLIQAIVSRMANNSFLLKGWSVTLAAALFALAAKDAKYDLALVALFPTLAFWGLDAYYLRQERLFRKLYDEVRRSLSVETETADSFSMSTQNYKKLVPSWLATLFAPSVGGLHGVIVATVAVVTVLIAFIA